MIDNITLFYWQLNKIVKVYNRIRIVCSHEFSCFITHLNSKSFTNLYVCVKLYEGVGPGCCVDFVTILVVKLLYTEFLQSAYLWKGFLEWHRIVDYSFKLRRRLGHHLGEIIKEGIGVLLAEVHLGQGEEAGLLLDDVTAYFT